MTRPLPASAWLAAVPPIALAVLTLAMLLMAAAGSHPMWPLEPGRTPEACGAPGR